VASSSASMMEWFVTFPPIGRTCRSMKQSAHWNSPLALVLVVVFLSPRRFVNTRMHVGSSPFYVTRESRMKVSYLSFRRVKHSSRKWLIFPPSIWPDAFEAIRPERRIVILRE